MAQFQSSVRIFVCMAPLLPLFGCADAPRGGAGASHARTSMGTMLCLPADLDPNAIGGTVIYSPSGARLAFGVSGGDIGVLTFDTGDVLRVGRDILNATDRSISTMSWVGDNHLALFENWITPEQQAAMDEDPPRVQVSGANRIVNLDTGETVSFAAGPEQRRIHYFNGAPDGRRIRYDLNGGHARIEYSNGILSDTSMNLDAGSLIGGGIPFPWLATTAAPSSTGFGRPVTLVLTNVESGETCEIPQFPKPSPFGVVLSRNGRWMFSANFTRAGGWTPFAYDTISNQRLELPADEAWIPISMSEDRGVLLVLLSDPVEAGNPSRAWAEIPLNDLLPQ